jgi:hypothetical protein
MLIGESAMESPSLPTTEGAMAAEAKAPALPMARSTE